MTISIENILYRNPPNGYVPLDSASFGRRLTFQTMNKRKTIAYVDGFNLFHAIDELGRPELKWVNLWSLSESLLREGEELVEVNYFSAYATWMPAKYKKHRDYTAALQFEGVNLVLGQFKDKFVKCKKCGRTRL